MAYYWFFTPNNNKKRAYYTIRNKNNRTYLYKCQIKKPNNEFSLCFDILAREKRKPEIDKES